MSTFLYTWWMLTAGKVTVQLFFCDKNVDIMHCSHVAYIFVIIFCTQNYRYFCDNVVLYMIRWIRSFCKGQNIFLECFVSQYQTFILKNICDIFAYVFMSTGGRVSVQLFFCDSNVEIMYCSHLAYIFVNTVPLVIVFCTQNCIYFCDNTVFHMN